MNISTPTAWKLTDVLLGSNVGVCRPSTPDSHVHLMPVANEAPHGRFLHRHQTTSDAQRKTVFVSASLAAQEGIADVTSTESRRFRQSTLGEATDAPRSETFCVDAVTEFCGTCPSQSRRRPDDVSFHVHTWARSTTKQLFQQLTFSMSSRNDWDDANNT